MTDVSIVAASGRFDPAKLQLGLDFLAQGSFLPTYTPVAHDHQPYLAGSDAERTTNLIAALEGPSSVLWLARGGYGAARLLPHLSLAQIKRANKVLVGFSDATALHALWARAGLRSVHGANVTTLPDWSASARQELFALVTHPGSCCYEGLPWRGGDTVCGPLLGGNLTVLQCLAGTSFLPSFRDAIVFFEDVGEQPYRLHRAVTQLIHCGAFVEAAGFAIGQLTPREAAGTHDPRACREAVCTALEPLGKPILGNLPLGHETSSRAVQLGVDATLDTVRGRLLVG